jgi:toll-like receptor 13
VYTYDAFVSYNESDRDLVYDHLVPHLESGADLRLCLHHRDFAPGRTIFENIVDALENSRSCVIVLSKEYAK